MTYRKKLIEVALPLDAINKASKREKSIRHGHPSTLHLWWARRPLAAARAVIFAQMVDDPSANPDLFRTERAQERERQRLFRIIEQLVLWENTTNEAVLEQARQEIWQSWRRACAENADHPQAKELFDRHALPAFHDPFAGGGSLPLEAQRLGMDAHASDLNPVAVLINKAMIEIPPRFAGKPPVNPEARSEKRLMDQVWHGAQGLAEDMRYYGRWMRHQAEERIGHLYPKVLVTAEMATDRPDLESYIGRELAVVAWLWTRTVRSPNPAFRDVEVPLASTFVLSSRKGKEAYVKPVVEDKCYRFTIQVGTPPPTAKAGTRQSRNSFRCLISNVPITYAYIDDEANADRMEARLMAVVVAGDRERLYLPPTDEVERVARSAEPTWKPSTPSRGTWASNAQGRRYGFRTFGDYFTDRQLVALTTFSDLISEAMQSIRHDALAAGPAADALPLRDGGTGATAYGEAVGVYLAFALSKMADRGSTICTWFTGRDSSRNTFSRQGIPMTWDYAELNTLLSSTGSYVGAVDWTAESLEGVVAESGIKVGIGEQADAATQTITSGKIVSTDPPYYDNIGYADLSDFFYTWLRRSLRPVFPALFSTLAVPKSEELVADAYRHGGNDTAAAFFMGGMTAVMRSLRQQGHPSFPITIYYAFKQSERRDDAGMSSTGWETFLDAVMRAGLAVSGTWPIRTELGNRMVGMGTNALASSIVLVCRPRESGAQSATRRELQEALRTEFPRALVQLQRSNIAPVDLAQASIGPGMAVFTSYREVLNADGSKMSVREALALINATLDEVLAEQEGDFDADTRWAVTWSEQFGYDEGEYGVAEQLSKAKNTSVDGLVRAGIIESRRGAVRIFRPAELDEGWDPATDTRLTVWEMTQHLIRLLETGGEPAAGELAAKLGSQAEAARDLAYRLYVVSERNRRAADALAYNGLVQSWPEIVRIAGEQRATVATQGALAIDGA